MIDYDLRIKIIENSIFTRKKKQKKNMQKITRGKKNYLINKDSFL